MRFVLLAAAGQQASAKADITAITVGLEWSDTDLTYNGTEQKPTATATGVLEGDECAVTVSGGQTNAGENYTATAESLSNENYVLPDNKTTLFHIAKAGQDAPSAPKMSERTNHSITLTKLDNTQYKMGDGEWQDSNVFDNLNANTEYTFYQRTIGDKNHEDSPSSEGAAFTTGEHVHEWTLTANGATVNGVCANSDHGHTEQTDQNISIVKPTTDIYGDGGSTEATTLGTIQGTTTSAITYRKGDEVLDSAPTDAGTYTASITACIGSHQLLLKPEIDSKHGPIKAKLTLTIYDKDFPARPTMHVGGWDYVNGGNKYYRSPKNLKPKLAVMKDMYVDSPWATSAGSEALVSVTRNSI